MRKFEIITDTNSGITPTLAKELDIRLIAMPYILDGQTYYEYRDLSYEEFFERLAAGADVSTSQPSPSDITGAFDEALKSAEQVIYLPMSSGLSSTCETARALAQDYEGRVFVIDNKRISLNLHDAVDDALAMRRAGYDAAAAADYLTRTAMDSDILVSVNTLTYLKKGGRVTPAAAAIGSVLGIKPVLRIHGDKLDAYKKVRGMPAAMELMVNAIRDEEKELFSGVKSRVCVAYSGDPAVGKEWQKLVKSYFPGREIILEALPISISCHVGPGALGISVSKLFEP